MNGQTPQGGIPVLWIGAGAVALWLLTAAPGLWHPAPIMPFLPFLAGPIVHFEKKGRGKFRLTWTFRDWIGFCLFLAVGYAMWKGVDPKWLFERLAKLAG